jgi:hypothetical protein
MKRLFFSILALSILVSGCSTYKTQYTGFRPPEDYANTQRIGSVTIGAEAYPDKEAAKQAFGFDIKAAGLLPVQIVLDNPGTDSFEVITPQTFLVDQTNRYWQLIPNHVAVERVEEATEAGAILKGAGKKGMYGAATGAILGAAIGIVTGQNVAEAAGTGAVIGGAGGAVMGGAQEGSSKEREYRISDDLRNKGIEGKNIPPISLANGFLFFPAEAETAKELRVQIREKGTGRIHQLLLPFPAQ